MSNSSIGSSVVWIIVIECHFLEEGVMLSKDIDDIVLGSISETRRAKDDIP